MNSSYSQLHFNTYLVNPTKPLNTNSAKEAVQIFQDLSNQGAKQVIINLEDVPYIDSKGLAALVEGYRIFGSEAKNFRLAGLQDQPKLLFELTRFDGIFQIFDSVARAVETKPNSHEHPRQKSLPFEPQQITFDLAV